MSPTPNTASHPSFFSKYKFTLISLVILLLAIIPLAALSKQHKATTNITGPVATPTPTTVPFTSDNAQPTIDAADQSIQSALQQADTDVQAANQVDASQDNVTGL